MSEIEEVIRKDMLALVQYIPEHKVISEDLQQGIIDLIEIVNNQKQELSHVESVCSLNFNIEGFEEHKQKLLQVVIEEIDESLIRIKNKMNLLKHINDDMQNHIEKLEKSTLEFDWCSTSTIRDGNEYQPPLIEFLQLCLEYRTYIFDKTKNIFHSYDMLDIKNGESVKKLKDSIKFDDLIVGKLIAITQYIN